MQAKLRRPQLILASILGAAALSACTIHLGEDGMSMHSWDDREGPSWWSGGRSAIQGDGVEASDERALESFSSIQLSGSFELRARSGLDQRVVVEGDENLLAFVETEVDDGVLEVRMKRGSYRPTRRILLDVSVPELTGLRIAGAAEAELEGLHGERFDVHVSGSAEVLGRGAVQNLELSIAGSAELDFDDVDAEEVEIRIAGSGKVLASAADRIEGHISGSGTIVYSGEARTQLSVSGSGSIRRK